LIVEIAAIQQQELKGDAMATVIDEKKVKKSKKDSTVKRVDNHIEPNLKSAKESLRKGWEEALKGETLPISELWKDIDAK
jgi:hypothetical protein